MGFWMALASAGPYAYNLHLAPYRSNFYMLDALSDTQPTVSALKATSTSSTVITHTHTHTHAFNGPLSGTTRVSRHQKGKTNLDFTEEKDSEGEWHQLGHMHVCTSLQTDNHASTPSLSFFTGQTPFLSPNQQCQSTEGKFKHSNYIDKNCGKNRQIIFRN